MRIKSKSQKEAPINLSYTLILLAYVLVAVFTPQMAAFDSSGPKFLALAMLNLLVFAFLLTRKELLQTDNATPIFFSSKAGLVYTLLMVISILSFVKSINLNESILQFCKTITVFIACYQLFIILSKEKRTLEPLAIGMVLLLILDNLTVYLQMGKFIKGDLANIELITSVYSNKNVLAASIFVKLPFALWLYTFNRDWKQKLALAGWGTSFLALFFLSSRAFYLGTLVLSVAYLVSLWVLSNKEKEKAYRWEIVLYAVVLASSLLLFTVVQKNLYSKSAAQGQPSLQSTSSIYNAGIVERLSQAKSTEYSTRERLEGWKRSWEVIKKEPLLGCGVGNWKIATLQEENLTRKELIYQYRAHNDFIETTTETGIFGGLLFLSLFVLLGWPFLKSLFKKEEELSATHSLFLPAFGLMAFAIDALFNFPHERPEIQILFALFVAAGIALTKQNPDHLPSSKSSELIHPVPRRSLHLTDKQYKTLSYSWKGTMLALLLFAAYMLLLNVQSLKMQKIVSDELATGKLSLHSDKILNGFPWFPDNTIFGEPIAVQKARYLIGERKYQQAIALLEGENANPYDSRREYFLASAWSQMGNPDSSLFWNRKVLQLKPYLLENIALMCSNLEKTGKIAEALPLIEKYLDHDKYNTKAWLLTTQYLDKAGDLKKAFEYSDNALIYHPTDPAILQNRDYCYTKLMTGSSYDSYVKAVASYKAKDHETAIQSFSQLIGIGIKLPKLFEYRAFCYYFTHQYDASNLDIDQLFALGNRQPNMLNLRGINLQSLGKQAEACTFFKEAMQAGDPEGKANFNSFCK